MVYLNHVDSYDVESKTSGHTLATRSDGRPDEKRTNSKPTDCFCIFYRSEIVQAFELGPIESQGDKTASSSGRQSLHGRRQTLRARGVNYCYINLFSVRASDEGSIGQQRAVFEKTQGSQEKRDADQVYSVSITTKKIMQLIDLGRK